MSNEPSSRRYHPNHPMTVPSDNYGKKRRYSTVATTRRRSSQNVVKHATTSRPVSIVPRNPSLRNGYQSTHLPGVNQRQKAQIQFFTQSVNAFAIAANTFTVPLKIQMNGPYDPDGAFSATQPATFAKYMTWYSKCVVTAAKVKVSLSNMAGATLGPMVWGITLLTNNTAPANITEAITGGTRTYRMVYGDLNPQIQTQKVDIAKFLGVNDLENNPDYACTSAANPAQLVVSQIWVQNPSGAAGAIYFTAEVDYDVVFYDPIIIT